MKAEFINPFIIATKNVLTTMARTHPNVGKPVVKQDDLTWGEVNGLIGMAGDEVTGNMVLSFDERSILAIVSAMLMEEFTTINADVIDAVGEITNMISGGAKKELSLQGFNFNMASPIMIRGRRVQISQLSKAPVISIPFTTDVGQFVLEANLAER